MQAMFRDAIYVISIQYLSIGQAGGTGLLLAFAENPFTDLRRGINSPMPAFGTSLRFSGSTAAGLVAVNIAAVVFGSTALFGKLEVSPIWIVVGRAAFAAITLLILAVVYRLPFRAHRTDLAKVGLTGLFLALHWVTFFTSVQEAGVAVATLTFATFPLFTVLIDARARQQLPTIIEVGAGLAIILAVSLLVGRGLSDGAVARNGAIVGLLSALFFALFSVSSQRLGQKLNPVVLSVYQNMVVVLFLAPGLPFAARIPSVHDWLIIAALGVIATALMHQLYFFSLKRLPASVCGGFVALEPVYAIIFASVLFSEPIGAMIVFSGALIIGASLLLLSRSEMGVAAN